MSMWPSFAARARSQRHATSAVCCGILLLAACLVNADELFVGTLYDGNVVQVSPDGQQSMFVNGVYQPTQMVFDHSGNLFVSSGANIIKITPDGTSSTFATGIYAHGLAFDSAGNLFAADLFSGNIIRIAPDGTQTLFSTIVGTAPGGLAFDGAGNLYVGRWNGSTITKITPDGTQSVFASGIDDCCSLVFDDSGNLLVLNAGNGTIVSITPDGVPHTVAGGYPYNFAYTTQLAIDSANNVYVADVPDASIYKMTPDGQLSLFATGLPYAFSMAMEPVPEPSTACMIFLGGVCVSIFGIRKRVA